MRRGILATTLALTLAALAGVGLATTINATVTHDPPLLEVRDEAGPAAKPNRMTITRESGRIVIHDSAGGSLVSHQGDEPGEPCFDDDGSSTHMRCDRAGIRRLLVLLGEGDDEALVDLGRSARKIRQRVVGATGSDSLVGGRGPQRLAGGEDNDILRGGPGRDVLVGGTGIDDCKGGRGRDRLKGCE